jgi:hypothetical protein
LSLVKEAYVTVAPTFCTVTVPAVVPPDPAKVTKALCILIQVPVICTGVTPFNSTSADLRL